VCVFRVQLCVFSRRPFLALLAAKVMSGTRASPDCDSCFFSVVSMHTCTWKARCYFSMILVNGNIVYGVFPFVRYCRKSGCVLIKTLFFFPPPMHPYH
jgi:hypothetical protein